MSGQLIDLLILLGVLAIVAIAAWFILQQITLPEPVQKILVVVIVVIAAIVGIMILLNVGGMGKRGALEPPFQVGTAVAAPAAGSATATAGHL